MAVSTFAQEADYLDDLMRHYFSFWKENADKVCEDEEDISGKVAIVTGSNTGIGKMIALQLAKRKAKVIMAVRDLEKGQSAVADIKKAIGDEIDIELMKLDLADLQSVRSFVKEFQSKYDHLNILVNNAGFMDTNGSIMLTTDGFETHIGVNHLGGFLLTKLLIPSLKKGTPSRIVCVQSSNIIIASFNLDDLVNTENVRTADYGKEQYSVSKLLSAVCMGILAKELGEDSGVKLYQLCPGYVKSDVFRNERGLLKKIRNSISLGVVGLSPHQGSETAVYCAVSKSLGESKESGKGEMYRFKKVWDKGNKILQNYVNSYSAEILFKTSEELVGLREKQLTQKKP